MLSALSFSAQLIGIGVGSSRVSQKDEEVSKTSRVDFLKEVNLVQKLNKHFSITAIINANTHSSIGIDRVHISSQGANDTALLGAAHLVFKHKSKVLV